MQNVRANHYLGQRKKERKYDIGTNNLRSKKQSEASASDINISNSDISKTRYRPTEHEKKYLIEGLNRYFSHPAYSKERNVVASQMIETLNQISHYWNHQNLSIWLRNNKKKYYSQKAILQNKTNHQIKLFFHNSNETKPNEFKISNEEKINSLFGEQNEIKQDNLIYILNEETKEAKLIGNENAFGEIVIPR